MENQITDITRRAILEHFELSADRYEGTLTEPEFLSRLYDLTKLPSTDPRFSDAEGDIWKHTVANEDWGKTWVFTDRRFNLLHTSDEAYLRFLGETLHPVVRPNPDAARRLAEAYNANLRHDGWRIVECGEVSGRPLFRAESTTRVAVFYEPTGWAKVDRQVQEVRSRLASAENEEQYQAIGLLCREVLITAAQEVFDPARYPQVDEQTPSDTDARRMLEPVFEVELAGSSNTEARAHARAAVKLALALQHKRTADFRTAALCAEGTASVVNMLAILAGRRGGRSG